MSKDYAIAISQVERIAQLCDFLVHPGLVAAIESNVPVTMPQTPGALGFDTGIWLGLGMVGLWAALDAFAERSGLPSSKCGTCGGKFCLSSRLASTGKLTPSECVALSELEDVRHLFAHNFSGQADALYFKWPRHVLNAMAHCTLSSGATFNGSAITLQPPHLRYYATQSREVLTKLV
jgi:hypothetical protein